MRHRNIETTIDIYAEATDRKKREAFDSLSKLDIFWEGFSVSKNWQQIHCADSKLTTVLFFLWGFEVMWIAVKLWENSFPRWSQSAAREAVKKSKKLLKFVLDDGSGEDRVILSGIHEYYEPEELVGKTCIAITNLPPRKMMGIDSCGMLISAVHEVDGHEGLNLLMVDGRIPAAQSSTKTRCTSFSESLGFQWNTPILHQPVSKSV